MMSFGGTARKMGRSVETDGYAMAVGRQPTAVAAYPTGTFRRGGVAAEACWAEYAQRRRDRSRRSSNSGRGSRGTEG